MKFFQNRGFIGSIEIDYEDKSLHGKLLYINDLIIYEATTISKLEREFKKAVNDYLMACKELGLNH